MLWRRKREDRSHGPRLSSEGVIFQARHVLRLHSPEGVRQLMPCGYYGPVSSGAPRKALQLGGKSSTEITHAGILRTSIHVL